MGGSEQTSLEATDAHMHIPGSDIALCLRSAQAVASQMCMLHYMK